MMWRRNVIVDRFVKPFLTATLLRPGATVTIFAGPSRGLRYRVFPGFGLAPIFGGWERGAQQLIRRHLRLGATAYDIGANYGVHTLLMARSVGKHGRVVSFEPVPEIRSDLRANVRLNRVNWVDCVGMAVSDRTGTERFYRSHHDGAGHLLSGGRGDVANGDAFEVPVVRLDDFVLEDGNRPPDFIKIDVEGSEGAVLAGAHEVLMRFRPVCLLDLHTPEQDVAVGRVLQRHGYTALRTDDMHPICCLTSGWPDPAGIWGQVLALPRDDLRQ